jgi:hypothetical protein
MDKQSRFSEDMLQWELLRLSSTEAEKKTKGQGTASISRHYLSILFHRIEQFSGFQAVFHWPLGTPRSYWSVHEFKSIYTTI